VVADRDSWEAKARTLEQELGMMVATTPPPNRGADDNKFRELKAALAKMFHPDALRLVSRFEAVAREELCKEINAAIDGIERPHMGSPDDLFKTVR
jgi:hypothetical protein